MNLKILAIVFALLAVCGSPLMAQSSVEQTGAQTPPSSEPDVSKLTDKNTGETRIPLTVSNLPATDALGRKLPTHEEVGDIRPDKLVAMFFWTWHSGQSVNGRNYDLTEIITTPDMVNDYDHPGWNDYPGGPFFWAEPLFGFYDGKDKWVIRKQLEMLAAAGVDALFYDATNGDYTWKEGYEAVGEVMEEAQADGVDMPQFAFMLNFGPIPETAYALAQLYQDLYGPGKYADSWFRWQGKPVIMAYPEAVGTPGDTAGQRFSATAPFSGLSTTCPSWSNDIGDLTFSLYAWTGNYAESVTRPPLARQTFVDFADNANLVMEFSAQGAGDYVWELSGARETVGVWKYEDETTGVESYFNGATVTGDYSSQIKIGESWSALSNGSSWVPVQIAPAVLVDYPGDKAGQRFQAASSFTGVDVNCPSWGYNNGDLTLSLYTWNGSYAASVAQVPLASQTFVDYLDNAFLALEFSSLPAGDYVWELSHPKQVAGVWKYAEETASIDSYYNGSLTTGDYISRIKTSGSWSALTSGSTMIPIRMEIELDDATLAAVLNFFTFRPGQPAYNTGPARNDQWGWLENYPQHGYVEKSPGEYEFMTVGVAQNWSEDIDGLSAMNGVQIHGRSYTHANGFSQLTPDSYLYGYNFQEQWDRALAVDPDMVFITGWNEWIAGRYPEWGGVENAFPDTYSPEYSRDIEPSKGWIGDNYYYQLIANIRRFKGMEKPAASSVAKIIKLDGAFSDWDDVGPFFTDSRGDVQQRDGYGYIDQNSPTGAYLHYTNNTGRNDIVGAKMTRDLTNLYGYVVTADNLTSPTDPNWMYLLIDADRDKATGWEGYEWRVDNYGANHTAKLSQSSDSWSWTPVGDVTYRVNGNEMELAIPLALLGLIADEPLDLEFKWLDTPNPTGDIMEVYTDGEAAPDGRFNFHFFEKEAPRFSSIRFD